jgi:hypothetical protein
MNKAELKAKWNGYCDTDKLVDDTCNLLTKYRHRNTEHGVCVMLDKYFTNKQPLIDLIKKSKHYVGDMRAVIDVELERENNSGNVYNFCYSFSNNVGAKNAIIKYTDANGKSRDDYAKSGISKLTAKDLAKSDVRTKLSTNAEAKDQFNIDGSTKESNVKYNEFNNIISRAFSGCSVPNLSGNVVNYIEQNKINVTLAEGMRTSRAFNRVCTIYGVDKLPKYNKLFAQYADMVSGLKRKMKFFISVNPLDYLTMSFGNSWSSCHTIDKTNARRMPNAYGGQYCGGTMSYMLDKTSIITYVYNSMPESIEDGKVYRNMFHYNNGTLIQSRIYPQGNDGATDLYKEFRNIVQNFLADVIGVTNKKWTKKSGGCRGNYATNGCHYPDYMYGTNCNVSYLSEIPNSSTNVITIGHNRICTYCGAEMGNSGTGSLAHGSCN